MSEPILRVEGVVKHYQASGGLLGRTPSVTRAVDGVTFRIGRGEVFGLVGETGSGKSTLGRAVVRLERPTSGAILFQGRDISSVPERDVRRIRKDLQIVFQDPSGSLDPRRRIDDIIGEGLRIHADDTNGWSRRSIRRERVAEMASAVGLTPDKLRRFPHELSGGQRQRVGIARALVIGPSLVVCDEPVSALDVSIQSQILNLLLDLRRRLGLTYLFIAHDLSVVRYVSDRVGVMYLGRLVEHGPVEDLYRDPRHPYTAALLSAVPTIRSGGPKRRILLEGDPPSPFDRPSGCAFADRCWLRRRLGNPENCRTATPELRRIDRGHEVACHWADVPTAVAELRSVVELAASTESDASWAVDATAESTAPTSGVP